ncbi:MAG TPA: glutamate-cysteine ligase family protein, partial [Acidimicrobiia bacterium]|nr:glutamate-cysteine ligase family protein [Acidimicrobiia bacterium]
MTGRDEHAELTPEAFRDLVAERCFGRPRAVARPGWVGLEVERFPIRRAGNGRPAGRVPIEGAASSIEVLESMAADDLLAPRRDVGGIPAYPVAGGGRVTFEPGGALEHATAPHPTAAAALAEVEAVGRRLSERFARAGVALASVGADPWHRLDSAPQQLHAFRYPAMHAYLAARSASGPFMMRHTCSLQVNLDLGGAEEWQHRWLAANLLAPLLTATFAASPDGGAVSARARAWQVLDPTRTGFPPGFLAGDADPIAHMTEAALDADVLLIRTADGARPGRKGWTFRAWLDGRWGQLRPTEADAAYHLTTLFHEVRPRGMLEFRGIDAVGHQWRSVPVTLLVGAIEDAVARDRVVRLLEGHRPALDGWWRRAAQTGVRDAAVCALAVEAW